MAPILDQPILIFEGYEDTVKVSAPQNAPPKEMSLWLKQKDNIYPSVHTTLLTKLDPGIYVVEDSQDGLFCKQININSDELFVFSDSITENLLNEINLFWEKADLYAKHRVVHKRGILLEGYPGTGKSSIITQLATEVIKYGGIVFKIKNFRNLDQYISFVQVGFRKIQPDTPVITIIEDIDQYDDYELELLDFLDGKSAINHHIVVATTNNTVEIPDTLLRPSRLDLKIEVPLPNAKVREEYFQFKNVPEELIKELVSKTENCSLADLKEIYVSIFLLDYSISEAISKVKNPKIKKSYLNAPTSRSKVGL